MRDAVRRTLAACAAAGTAVTLAAGCGEPADRAGTPGSTAPSGRMWAVSPAPGTGDRQEAVTAVTVTFAHGVVRTASRRVKVRRGTTVRITITSDTAEEFHLHGYDRELRLTPGRPATLEFTADAPGVFEAELHHAGTRVLELQVG